MKNLSIFIVFLLISITAQTQKYFPSANEWIKKDPSEVNMDPVKIQMAIDSAIANESKDNRNLEIHHYLTFGREPFGDGIGPLKDRGPMTGLIIKNGYIIAEWGDPSRVDMTHSVTKSFLSATVGVAYDRGLIRDVMDPVADYIGPIFPTDQRIYQDRADRIGQAMVIEPFTGEHNKKIRWDDLLRQTSDWEGTLWGKPDWADRPSGEKEDWMTRQRAAPGTTWEYNDTRVNLLALAATDLYRRPLQEVLKEAIMDPIGASSSWRWMGYHNSWIIMDGKSIQVPSGGGHWGGGMYINAYDQGRFGLLTLNRGVWNGKRILSEEWVTKSLTPTAPKPDYGYMNWFLNNDLVSLPDAPNTAFYHLGAGANIVYVDPLNDLVIVARWINRNAMNTVVKLVLDSMMD